LTDIFYCFTINFINEKGIFMDKSNRVHRLAGVLYAASIVVMIFVGLGTLIGIGVSFPTAEALQNSFPAIAVAPDIPQSLIVASVVVGVVPVAIWLWTLNQMRRLFGGYKTGAVLTDQSAHHIQRIGLGFMGIALVQLALVPIQGLILTWANPVGQRALSVGITSDMLGFLLAAGLMTVIGWAMREAAQAASENEAFI
jgi:multisubunit Na+/H+ antiporter MnhC subunit